MSLFHWCMRNAAGLLFAAGLLLLFSGLIPFLYELGGSFSRRASIVTETGQSQWLTLLSMLAGGIAAAVWPLFGAAVLYRLDRREQVRATFGAGND